MNKLLLLLFFFLCYNASGQLRFPCFPLSEKKSDWKCLGPFNAPDEISNQHFGLIMSMAINPANENEIYVGTGSAGLFYTNTKGKKWTCLTDNFEYPVIGIKDIIVDFSKTPNEIVFANGHENEWCNAIDIGIMHSKDGGKTWQNKFPKDKNVFTSASMLKIVIDATHNYWYIAEKNKIHRSTDEGAHWEEIFSQKIFPNQIKADHFIITSLVIDESNKRLYITTEAQIDFNFEKNAQPIESEFLVLTKIDLGLNEIKLISLTKQCQEKYNPDTDSITYLFKATKPSPSSNELFIVRQYRDSKETTIYNYDMQARKVLSSASPNKYHFGEDLHWFEGLKVNALNKAIQYFAGTTFSKSLDSGNHFKRLYAYSFGDNNIPHADVRCVTISKSSEDGESDHIFLGTDGGLSFSENGGKTFTNLNGEFLPITEFYGMGVSPFSGMISAGSQDNSIFSYDPKNKKWHLVIQGDGYDVEYSKVKPNIAFGQYNYLQLFKTSNDLAPFQELIKNNEPKIGSNRKTLFTHKNGTLYFADYNFNILRKDSSNWEKYSIGAPHQALSFAVSESNPEIVYLSSYWYKFYKSTNGGKSFIDMSTYLKFNDINFDGTRIQSITISPTNENELWISLGYLGDYENICKQTIRMLHSLDGGFTWNDYSQGLSVYNVMDMIYVDGTLNTFFAATIEGVYIREGDDDTWRLFSTNLPKCIITELQISYCRGKLIASTYGRGLWETELPTFKNQQKIIYKKSHVVKTDHENEAVYFTTDIILKKNARLEIKAPLHMAKGKSIFVHNEKQIRLTGKGKIINECGETWGGIQRIKK